MWSGHPAIRRCVAAMRTGGVIAYPTEAVWGLGCNPFDQGAVSEILQLKGRSWTKGLILAAGNMSHVEFLLQGLADEQRQRLEDSWPGHVTWLIPHHHRIPEIVYGQFDTVAIRVSAHPVVKALTEQMGGPIISTSANLQGQAPATLGVEARLRFRGKGVTFCAGAIGQQAKPSTIIDLETQRVIR